VNANEYPKQHRPPEHIRQFEIHKMQSPDTYQDDFFRFDFDSKVIFNEKRATKGFFDAKMLES
jgi:hypothetical protein